MTSLQFKKINTDLATTDDLKSNPKTRYNLINFFYKIKLNWDNYQLGKSMCSVTTDWKNNESSELEKNGLKSIHDQQMYQFRPVLAALFYNYLITTPIINGLYKNIIDAFNIEKDYKNNARNYFKGQCHCNKYLIDNYKKYYFVEPRKYLGNK